jgi:hypothetical protein
MRLLVSDEAGKHPIQLQMQRAFSGWLKESVESWFDMTESAFSLQEQAPLLGVCLFSG